MAPFKRPFDTHMEAADKGQEGQMEAGTKKVPQSAKKFKRRVDTSKPTDLYNAH